MCRNRPPVAAAYTYACALTLSLVLGSLQLHTKSSYIYLFATAPHQPFKKSFRQKQLIIFTDAIGTLKRRTTPVRYSMIIHANEIPAQIGIWVVQNVIWRLCPRPIK